MGFIHSKLRNLLSTKTVENLVYIRTNQHLVEGTQDGDDQKHPGAGKNLNL